jgi:3-oxoadipate enol-lactonase
VPVIERERGTLYYETYGSGRPLVFLHGMAGNTLVWWQQVAFLEERYRCILVDQRGWGRSAGPLPEPWTDAFVPDLEAVLEELGVEEFAVVAQSMGGWTVDAFCRRNPGRVRAAIMTGTTGGYVPPGTEAVYQKARETAAGMRSLWRAGRGPHPALGARAYDEQPALARLYEMLVKLNRPLDTDPDAGLPLTTEEHLRLPEDVLFIYGEEDPVCPREVVKAVAAGVPESVGHCVARSGHSVYFERADAFNREVSGFLSACYR